jgi:hypothetical protein
MNDKSSNNWNVKKFIESLQMMMILFIKKSFYNNWKIWLNSDNNPENENTRLICFFSWKRYSRFTWNYNEIEKIFFPNKLKWISLFFLFKVNRRISQWKKMKISYHWFYLISLLIFFSNWESLNLKFANYLVVRFDFIFNNS